MIGLEALNAMLLVTSRDCSKYSFYIKLLIRRISSKRLCLVIRGCFIIISRQIKLL